MKAYRLPSDSRETVAIILICFALVALFLGAMRLQVFRYSELAELADTNRLRVQPIVPKRGVMFDRHGAPLVDNRLSYAVSIVRTEMVKGKTIPLMAELTGYDTTLVLNKLRRNRGPMYLPAIIKRDVTFDKVSILEEQNLSFPGVTYDIDLVRRYSGSMAGECFTGYIGESDEDDSSAGVKLRPGSFIGKQGLERTYDALLRGREGTRYLEVTAAGAVMGEMNDEVSGKRLDPGEPGTDLVLTIDAELQRAAATELDSFCCGAIVAIDPRNGEILAMVSRPTFDANTFSSVVPADLWRQIVNDSDRPLLNRPVNARYAPGSTFKLLTVGAMLEEKLVDRYTMFAPCLGGWQFGSRFFRCWEERGHGRLALVDAIKYSCDPYFYQAGARIGQQKLSEYTSRCGFGKKTGVDLPSENAGLVPTPELMNKLYPRGWTRAASLNFAIGQGELVVTPLQLAQFYCGLANGGKVFRPHLVRSLIHPNGAIESPTPTLSFTLPFSAATLAILNESLDAVVNQLGTAHRIADPVIRIVGKTGTTENSHGEPHSWFVGYAPFDKPEIVVCAIGENAGHGSDVAAPVVGRLIKSYLRKRFPLATPLAPVAQTNPPTGDAQSALGAGLGR